MSMAIEKNNGKKKFSYSLRYTVSDEAIVQKVRSITTTMSFPTSDGFTARVIYALENESARDVYPLE